MDAEKRIRALLKGQRRSDARALDRQLIATAALLDSGLKSLRESKKQTDLKLKALVAAQIGTEEKSNRPLDRKNSNGHK